MFGVPQHQVRTADRWHFAAANWNAALTHALLDSTNLTPSCCLVIDFPLSA
jgi:hypothetical protein